MLLYHVRILRKWENHTTIQNMRSMSYSSFLSNQVTKNMKNMEIRYSSKISLTLCFELHSTYTILEYYKDNHNIRLDVQLYAQRISLTSIIYQEVWKTNIPSFSCGINNSPPLYIRNGEMSVFLYYACGITQVYNIRFVFPSNDSYDILCMN